MKTKALITLAHIVISAFTASATILYTAPCGKSTYTIDKSYFDSQEEANKYYAWLDRYLCANTSDKADTESTEEFVSSELDDAEVPL